MAPRKRRQITPIIFRKIHRKEFKTSFLNPYIEADTKEILAELKAIRTELTYLKENIVDLDIVLTDTDIKALEQADKDLKTGKTKKLI